ncbi:pyridoxamine 5'-phosphate oxidase family protein [Celeribacter marinus]|uniref:pyridoxamine 5'-phosphate oxidase family protein n=1 Tax=Celeribacter marinus TaxID=1397108 RepID=UPI00317AB829
MTDFTINPDFNVTSETALRDMFPPTHDLAKVKQLDHLDAHAMDYIRRSPFVVLGTQSADGTADVSPRGDPKGFVEILDATTIAIPDRPGNNRLDSLVNITTNPKVGLLFIVPGFDDTLRVNGAATLTTDPELLATMAVNGRAPTLAIVVKIEEAFLHCAKAFRRSKLWDPSEHQNRSELPSLINLILEQVGDGPKSDEARKANDDAIEEAYKGSMY